MTKKLVGVYPGTFDPMTNGHLDVISRATRVVDELIIGVAANVGKSPMFTIEERAAMVEEELPHLSNTNGLKIEVRPFKTLLMHFVMESGASVIIRGLRAVSDFEYEFQMAGMNSRLNQDVETVFLMASDKHQFISSRFVKEIGLLGGDVGHFVSPRVEQKLRERFSSLSGARDESR
jgi:pantetheine-phosphate adenylyltransferase